jgi:hypothetical protein
MDNKRDVSPELRTFLNSKEFGPLAKFFILLRMGTILESRDSATQKRVWTELKEKL